LRRKIKGWNKNREVEIRKEKRDLISEEEDELDLLAESRILSDLEHGRRKEISLKLD
jgi:hypothetical protein